MGAQVYVGPVPDRREFLVRFLSTRFLWESYGQSVPAQRGRLMTSFVTAPVRERLRSSCR